MGTRSITNVHSGDKSSPILVSIYQQYDGYFDGVGKDLKRFLDGFTIVNGFNPETPKKAANGMDCLAAQVVKYLKDGIGGTYLYPIGSEEEFNYHIYIDSDENLCLEGEGYGETKKFKLSPP